MSISSPDAQTAYLDFAQFNKLKQEYRQDAEAGMRATARQLEGVFLNMMLKTMREANGVFSEGNYLTSKDADYYRQMYDQQMSQTLASGRGIGLADMIVRQMQRLEKGKARADATAAVEPPRSYEIAPYRERAIPALLRRELSDLERRAAEQELERATPEARIFAGLDAVRTQRQAAAAWQSPEEFVAAILPHARRAAQELNVDPMAIVAQAVLETGWGRHVMQDEKGKPSFNLFGIKAHASWDGNVVRKKTLEYRNGIAAQEYAAFRSYDSLASAFDDYVKFLKENPRYAAALKSNTEAKQWGYALQQAGYATDPNYGNKIAQLLDSDILQIAATTL